MESKGGAAVDLGVAKKEGEPIAGKKNSLGLDLFTTNSSLSLSLSHSLTLSHSPAPLSLSCKTHLTAAAAATAEPSAYF